jgi:putative salt-induced outer membrane protein
MRLQTLIAVGVIGAAAASAASAQQTQGLSGRVGFGYLATSGNADSENANVTLAGEYNADRWHHELDARAVKASANSVDTAEAYGLAWKSKYDLTDADYLFGLFAWDRDEFSTYDRQLREVVGYGRRLIDTQRQTFAVEAGAGFRQSDLRDGTSEDGAIVRLGADYRYTFSETSYFDQTLAIESGSDNTYTEAVSALHADVWANTALVISYAIKHNTDVLPGTVKRDTFTAVSLEYSF